VGVPANPFKLHRNDHRIGQHQGDGGTLVALADFQDGRNLNLFGFAQKRGWIVGHESPVVPFLF
jgi:hypothetical protein